MNTCRVCYRKKNKKIINFGKHPVSHKFSDGKNKDKKFTLELGQCQSCGLVQLTKIIPMKKLVPKFEWITYNEPEKHLDSLSKVITKLPGINKNSKICGVSYKEDTVLERLKKKGFKKTWRMHAKNDLKILDKKANLETIQNKINENTANLIKKKHGQQDVIIVRHILEHTHNTHEFMSGLKKMIKEDGYIVFEVPDCTNGFKIKDYNTLWEEHVFYFTNVTLKNTLQLGGFNTYFFKKYKYPFESVLVNIVKKNKNKIKKINESYIKKELSKLKFTKKNLERKKIDLKNYIKRYKKKENQVAIFGTGHAACLFINLFEVKNLIDFAIDDNLKKTGYFIPGSKIPIYNSKILQQKKIKLCLLGVSSDSETKILKNHKSFTEKGNFFASIYPSSKYAIRA